MVGMVLSAGQTVIPGGWMGAEGSPTPVVLIDLTLLLYTLPEMRLGHCAPAPKLKLFWRRRSLKRPMPPRTAIFPSPKTSYAKPTRGSGIVLAAENPWGVPEQGSQTSPSGANTFRGSPFRKPLLKLMVGFWEASYLLGSTEYSVHVPSPPGVPPRTDRKSTRLNSSHLGISYAVFCL